MPDIRIGLGMLESDASTSGAHSNAIRTANASAADALAGRADRSANSATGGVKMKLGLNPFTHTLKTARQFHATAQILDALGKPPDHSPGYSGNADLQTGGDWGMDGNEQYGDCVDADVSHRVMLRTAQMGAGKMIKPTAAETLALYSEITGFDPNDPNTDRGGDLVTTATYMQKTGMLIGGVRHTEDGNGVVDPANVDHIKWAICLFGCTPIAIDCPKSAQDQFQAGEPWDYVPGSPIEGGHDVLLVEYRPDTPSNPPWLVVTWGKRQPVTQAFMDHYLKEVVPVGAKDFITANGLAPSGINLAKTLQILSEIN